MNKIEIIKSLYEELTDEERIEINKLLKIEMEDSKEYSNSIDFYSDEFIDFITHSNHFRKLIYMLDCEEIEQIYYVDIKGEKHIFNTHDEAEEYFEKYFDSVMKMKYEENSNEYQCFKILSSFDFDNVKESCEKLGYTIGLENKPITKERLIKDSVEMFRELCSKEDITFRQIGRLHAFKIFYPKGNYFSLMYCIELYDNAFC